MLSPKPPPETYEIFLVSHKVPVTAAKKLWRWKPCRGLRGPHSPHSFLVYRAPEVTGKARKSPKAKVAFCSTVPQHTALGKARPNLVD